MVAFGETVILPGEPDWFIPKTESLYILAPATTGPDAMVFSAALEGERYTIDDDYSRFYRYDAGRWLCVTVAASISSLLVLQPPQAKGEGLVVLGERGQVWFVGDQTRTEQIQTTEGSNWHGALVQLRRTGGTFFAVGLDGQCYRRDGAMWVNDDEGLRGFDPPFPRKRPCDVGEMTFVTDIATLPNGDQYLCGSVAIARPAIFWRPSGVGRWHWLGYAVDDPAYDFLVPGRILVQPPDTVWITTDEGVLVRGNAAQGMRTATATAVGAPDSASATGTRASFSNAVFYDGAIHAGSNVGTFRLRGDKGWDLLAPPGSLPDAQPLVGRGWLDASDGMLWAFDTDSVARYDGQRWHDVPIPNLYR